MATAIAPDIEDQARQVRATMRYVDEGDFVTRRYVSNGAELNTGTYSDHQITIRDAMPIGTRSSARRWPASPGL